MVTLLSQFLIGLLLLIFIIFIQPASEDIEHNALSIGAKGIFDPKLFIGNKPHEGRYIQVLIEPIYVDQES